MPESLEYELFDVSMFLDVLQPGSNMLAIHGLNFTADDPDFLILPDLVSNSRRYFGNPTPESANSTGFVDFVADTKFSVDRGFFDAPLDVAITSATPGATIYYTLDGSEPTEDHGTKYTGPIHVDHTTTLRAAAFKEDLQPTGVDTQTYIFLDDVLTQSETARPGPGWPLPGQLNGQILSWGMEPSIVNDPQWDVRAALEAVATISLVTDLKHLFNSSTGIFVNANLDGRSWERPVSLELIYPENATGAGFPDGADDGFQVEAGARIRGGYSSQDANPKHAFRFFFRDEYGDVALEYPLFGDEGADRFDKVDLRTSQNYSWAFGGPNNNTMLRDVASRDIQGNMGQPYTRSRYYHLYLNGHYWGLFQTQERAEARFAASYMGGDADDYDVIKQNNNDGRRIFATDGNTLAYQRLWQATLGGYADNEDYFRARGMNPDGTWNPSYERMLDVDNLIDYMVLTYYTGDRDGPGSKYTRPRPNNYYAIYNRANPDGWKFFEHDSEHSLGTGANDMVTPLLSGDSRADDFENFNAHWLHEQLCANEEYRLRFADAVYKHLYNDGELTYQAVVEVINERAEQIDSAIVAESARWGDQKANPPKDRDDWLGDVNEIRSWISSRTGTVINQLKGQGWYPNVNPPNYNKHGGQVTPGYGVTLTGSGAIYYTVDGADPREIGGAVNTDSGQLYTSSISIHDGTVIKARVRSGGVWSPLAEAQFTIGDPAAADNLAITEINYHPYDPTDAELAIQPVQDAPFENADFEFVELQNISAAAIDLSDVEFIEGVDFAFGTNTLYLLENGFDADAEGFTYADDVFGGTSRPGLADGSYDASAGVGDTGGLFVQLGTHTSGDAASGGWSQTFHLDTAAKVDVSLQYRMILGQDLQAGEFGEVILAIDAARYGSDTNDSLIHRAGDGNGGSNYDTGWRAADLSVTLSAGDHTVTIGAYNNAAVVGNSFVRAMFDSLAITTSTDLPELAAGQYIVLANNLEALAARSHLTGVLVGGEYSGNLNNAGERIRLIDVDEEEFINLRYNDSGSWPGRADGKGATL
ncbi:MAG: chitobiase/beta-hexosaminidase C-terminal domain-containing protein, partial [Candidatus Nealsonbacteria bacterium]|nr:chitobiase/beta-hexosaminidase C-terminal domain-containing protein [Candidatus Nealsonbacteria bacterium]